MSKQISVNYKEYCVLRHLWDMQIIVPNVGVTAIELMNGTNEDIIGEMEGEQESLVDSSDENSNKTSDTKSTKRPKTLSRAVLYRIIKKLLEAGMINEGVKDDMANTYYITVKGAEFYANLTELNNTATNKLLDVKEQIDSGNSGIIL